jgi:hypothetical protein
MRIEGLPALGNPFFFAMMVRLFGRPSIADALASEQFTENTFFREVCDA